MKYLDKYGKWIFTLVLVTVVVSSSVAAVGIFNPTEVSACGPGNQGLTPGFWKNHTDDWPANRLPGHLVSSLFTGAGADGLGDATLLEALKKFKDDKKTADGAAMILLRAGVAAALNAESDFVSYPVSLGKVQDMVNGALALGDRDNMLDVKDILDGWNNLGVPGM